MVTPGFTLLPAAHFQGHSLVNLCCKDTRRWMSVCFLKWNQYCFYFYEYALNLNKEKCARDEELAVWKVLLPLLSYPVGWNTSESLVGCNCLQKGFSTYLCVISHESTKFRKLWHKNCSSLQCTWFWCIRKMRKCDFFLVHMIWCHCQVHQYCSHWGCVWKMADIFSILSWFSPCLSLFLKVFVCRYMAFCEEKPNFWFVSVNDS